MHRNIHATPHGNRWSIVLSGGEGERLRPWVERVHGHSRPKQYCSFLGRRTMLEHALDRAVVASAPDRVVTVIGGGHSRHLTESGAVLPGRIIEQPSNRDTAPGIMLPLTYVMAEDPDAVVAIFPSDHYIAPNDRFNAHVERAYLLAERLDNKIILFGAVPDRPEPDYGWIQPEHELRAGVGPGVWSVRHFHEKPGKNDAAGYFRDGYLWNTFIMFAKAKTLWALAADRIPEIQGRFDVLRRAAGTRREPSVLADIYEDMRPANFSTRILETCTDRTLVVTLDGVDWSDWGRPERIEETLLKADRPMSAAFIRPASSVRLYPALSR